MTAPRFFASPKAFGRWLAAHHDSATELWIGFHRKHASRKGMTYLEAVEEALCWGWIDGLVRRRDADSYQQRFTPRTSRSTWSLVNISRVERLAEAGRMRASGLLAFQARDPARTGVYSFEQERVALTAAHAKRFRAEPGAWSWFASQSGSYRRVTIHWINSAKQAATRERRLVILIAHSAQGSKLRQFTPMPERDR